MHHQNSNQLTEMSSDKFHVLIVDDEEGILRSLQLDLRKHYQVFTANNTFKAMEILYQEDIQIILCDEKMPLERGSDFLAKVKVNFPQRVRILFSGYTDIQAVQKAVNSANVFKFLFKPWNFQELQEVLIEAKKYYQLLNSTPYFDNLTQLKSAPALRDLLEREIKRSRRYQHEFSCVMLDIKDLHMINQLHGAHAGDLIIQQVSNMILHEIRDSDFAGRWEEDHFLILLTETNASGMQVFLQRCRQAMDQLSFELEGTPIPFEITFATTVLSEKNCEITVDHVINRLQNQL
ncbi:MAG: diguanylate cyclase [SAR324 cluster bacterium]|nr:diguanylate cyclase [SAR324 cluster bacterium]